MAYRPRWVPRSPAAPVIAQATLAIQALDSRVRLDFKRAIVAGILSLGCLIAGVDLGGITENGTRRWVVLGLTIAFVVFGALGVRSAARELNRFARHKAGYSTASALRTICLLVGAAFILLGTMQLLAVDLRTILVGGAITGVVVGIAAQQTLGNFFAGLVLLFARPYVPGEYVRIHSGALNGPFDGRIVYAGLMYSSIETAEGRINIPNLALMAAAIGAIPEPVPAAEAEVVDPPPVEG
jgi:small conductance mechanosensitive channel